MGPSLRVLVVGSPAEDAAPWLADLERAGSIASSERVSTLDGLRAALSTGGFDLLVALPAGLALLREDAAERGSLEARGARAREHEVVGRLAGGVAHDFNNLLVAILGYAEVLQPHVAEGGPGRRYLEEIRKAGERAATLSRRLLTLTSEQALDPQPLDAGSLVRELAPMLERLLGEEMHLLTRCAAGLPRALADRGQLEQALLHLAVRARDSMPKGGTLSVATAEDEVRERPGRPKGVKPGRYVVISVRDSGSGMSADEVARLFEPSAGEEGSHEDLAAVQETVRRAGGDIDAWSQPGKGTAFTIYLPQTDAPGGRPEGAGLPASESGKEIVLLVDDEDAVRAIAKEVLEEAGYRVLEASTGLEAKAICDRPSQPVNLLLADLTMPDMGGVDLALVVSATRPKIRVLLTSGYSARGIDLEKLSHVQAAFLQKPFSPHVLLRTVRQVLDAPPPAQPPAPLPGRNSAASPR